MATNQSTPPEQSPPRSSGDCAAVDHADGESARIADLRAEINDLEAELERERRRRQSVIQRYERLLDERGCEADGEQEETGRAFGELLSRLR
ncbi:hypothetical protein [Halostella sp. PRR32]|uniref:hypothetical protein n=1 Tax=Halostella sp. PRR32 TaxID=3098147 RepID=UPI002B1D85EA|nr:hypothetical protein [Halostella sp. PRR32]